MAIDRISRRTFVTNLALGAAAAPALRTAAAALPNLDPGDPAAAKQGYVEDATHVDLKRFPGYVKGSNCDNCLLLAGTAGSNYRPCSLFPGKLVAVTGWCSGWTAEM